MSYGLLFALICAIIALVYGVASIKWILGQPAGNERMREIAAAIQQGATAYLNRQYRTIGIVGVVLFVVIGVGLNSWITAGLRGSSSGIPASTLPTRSAPTSAPLVKMPPPRRAKIEISEPPKARPTSG